MPASDKNSHLAGSDRFCHTTYTYNMKTSPCNSPLRKLRESLCGSRSDFCRRYRLGYQSVALAEVGLVQNPVNLLTVLGKLTGRPVESILAEHEAWLVSRQQTA